MRTLEKLFGLNKHKRLKIWENSQEFEFKHCRLFMESDAFKSYYAQLRSEPSPERTRQMREGLANLFFKGHEDEFPAICEHARQRQNLEIGSSCAPAIFAFESEIEPVIIEPMGQKIVDYQRKHFSDDVFQHSRLFAMDAAIPIEELEGSIDGVIYVRNCIDHTPKWPFVMANIAHYAKPGCKLIFWSEMSHGPAPDIGHYNITDDVNDFLRLVDALGFDVDHHFSNVPSLPDLGLVATRR
ncbi:hypothetical protein [Hoeflea sp.]|uniref:hypothetical protein n=1 Tax=Hoeflea sp. TaxID=1940281 RepID=UPI003BAFACBD